MICRATVLILFSCSFWMSLRFEVFCHELHSPFTSLSLLVTSSTTFAAGV
eukprot:m.39629 g.39629  ORF g.39629 m.39629 type:complete len:50 (-) comp10336_c0_seq1:17-166(-)